MQSNSRKGENRIKAAHYHTVTCLKALLLLLWLFFFLMKSLFLMTFLGHVNVETHYINPGVSYRLKKYKIISKHT